MLSGRCVQMIAGGGASVVALFGVALAASPQPPAKAVLAREARSVKAVCGMCHDLQIVRDTPMSLDAWQDTVQQMVDRGAHGTDAQFDDVMDYLHRTMTTIAVNSADANELQLVLDVPPAVAESIIKRRETRRFTDLDDLKSVSGIDGRQLDEKARLIFFN